MPDLVGARAAQFRRSPSSENPPKEQQDNNTVPQVWLFHRSSCVGYDVHALVGDTCNASSAAAIKQ